MILITGATGFIGHYLTNSLLLDGQRVRVLTRDISKARTLLPKAEIARGDLLDPPSLPHALEGVDKIIHLAGMISYSLPREELFRLNVEGTRNLLQACRKVKKIIFASSVSVYGETFQKVSEQSPPSPRNPYGESKLAAEKLIQEAPIRSLILRLGVVYGNSSPIWDNVMKFFYKGFPIPKAPTKTNLIHISDVCRAFRIGLEKGEGVYNIAAEKSIPFIELASLLAYHLDMRPNFQPVWLVRFLARFKGKQGEIETFIQNRDYDVSKARQDLGFAPEAFLEKEIRNMVDNFRRRNSSLFLSPPKRKPRFRLPIHRPNSQTI